MTWSGDTLGPYASQEGSSVTAAGRRNEVRLRLADVDSGRHLIEDEQLDAFLTIAGDSLIPAAIAAARFVKSRFAAKTKSRTRTNPDGTQTLEDWTDVIPRMEEIIRDLITTGGPLPIIGGISRDDIENQDDNDDNLPPWFSDAQPGNPVDDQDGDLYVHIPRDLEGNS